MDNLSHSLHKKTYNANGFVGKAVYDDVFGGPPRFGLPTLSPRVEDYCEIFGGFHASRPSSIPILDLPAVQEVDVAFDAPRSKFDYYEVFGGFDGLDFFVSYEDLCSKPRDGDESSDEAWTPAQSEYLSDESDHSAYSEENHNFSNGYSHLSSDGSKQFNISYQKANQRSKENVSNGMAHITQLHAIPGNSFIVDETSRRIEAKNQPLQVTNDVNHTMDQSMGRREGKQLRKTMSHPSNSSFSMQTFGNNFNPLEGYGKTDSAPNQTFLSVSNISLRTQPSQVPPPLRPPPSLAVKQGDSDRRNSKLKASKSFAFERTAGDSSPPFFDVEIDASSSAAASVAAMKDAMDKAQAKLRTAKELMERKKEGLQSHMKLGLKSDKKDREQKMCNNFDGLNNFKDERMQGTCNREQSGMKSLAGAGKKEERKTTQVASNSTEGERHKNVANISAEEKNGKEYRFSEASCVTKIPVAWREETEFYELVEANKLQEVFGQAKGANILGQNAQSYGSLQEKRALVESFVPQEEDNREVKEAREACVWEEGEVADWAPGWGENNKISKATKVSCSHKEIEKKVKFDQEVSERGENVHKLRVAQHADIEIVLTEADNWEEHEKLLEFQWKESDMETALKLNEANEERENERRLKNAYKREENNKRPKEILEMEKFEKRLKEPVHPAENENKLKEALEQEEKEKQQMEACESEEDEKMREEAHERGENDDKLKALKQEDNDKILRETLEWEEGEKRSKMILEQEENEKKQKLALEREENRMRLMEPPKQEEKEKKQEDNDKILRENLEWEVGEKRSKKILEQEENEKKQKLALEREENRMRLMEPPKLEEKEKKQEDNDKVLRETLEWEEGEKRSKMVLEQEKNEKKQKLALEREENRMRLMEAPKQEEKEKKLKCHLAKEENTQKRKETYQREENERRIHKAHEREEKERRLREALEQEEINKRLQEMEESKKPLKDASKWQEIEKSSDKADELEEKESSINHAGHLEEVKGQGKEDDQTEMDENERKEPLIHMERENFKAFSVACKLDDDENLQATQVACKHSKSKGQLEVTEAAFSCGEDKLARTEPKDIEGKMEDVEMDNVLVEEKINSSGMDHDVTRHEKKQIGADYAMESHCLYGNVTKSVEPGISFGQTDIERNKRASELAFDLKNLNILIHEGVERGTCFKEALVAFDQKESKDKFLPLQVDAELVENGRKMRTVELAVLERKKIAQEESTRQNIEKKKSNLNEDLMPKDRQNEERMKRQKKLEEEQRRKIEEEREREKDRMVVERAVCEAREKAFMEARERAERAAVDRANAEVRQRAMAEARERLEKAGAEARERSLTEKASMEARVKVRAERAAVERATSEARERAAEKAMAEKAAHEGQEPIEKSVADNFSTSSGDGGIRQTYSFSDLQGLQFQNTVPSSESRYSYSSGHGGVQSESAQRCKARLERHRRTAERAAKALAEKNMRDLLAQREQAERNRLAEGLGAEVKRWSSGKEGNLRALLSTLQYILGPDSGWHPVPLTEVITAAAVKKAYRKATLCVHPDKLQQRGASIQQKYICEKIFDLLKEAWNKFNSEEP